MEKQIGLIAETLNSVLGEVINLGKRIGSLEQRMDGFDQRMDGLEQRMGNLEQRMNGLDQRMISFEYQLKFQINRLERKIDESLEFTRDSIVFIGDKVFGDHEERLTAIENS